MIRLSNFFDRLLENALAFSDPLCDVPLRALELRGAHSSLVQRATQPEEHHVRHRSDSVVRYEDGALRSTSD